MDGSRIRNEKVADSTISGYVWTGPQKHSYLKLVLRRSKKAAFNRVTLRFHISHFRSFYVSVSDESGIEPERLCGNKSRFTVLREGHRVDVTYYSTQYSSSWTGFLARYFVLNESLSSGKQLLYKSNNNKSLLTKFEQVVSQRRRVPYYYLIKYTQPNLETKGYLYIEPGK